MLVGVGIPPRLDRHVITIFALSMPMAAHVSRSSDQPSVATADGRSRPAHESHSMGPGRDDAPRSGRGPHDRRGPHLARATVTRQRVSAITLTRITRNMSMSGCLLELSDWLVKERECVFKKQVCRACQPGWGECHRQDSARCAGVRDCSAREPVA